ncbi:hypothetical protein ACFLUY_01225 [Chloroflexota bacterium]
MKSVEVLRRSLLEINNRCQSLRQDIEEFVNSVLTLPAAMIKIRLQTMSIRITMQTSRLHNMHDGKGIVFVIMSNTVLSVQWAENELSIEGKENFKRCGYLTLSLEEISKVVEHLLARIDSEQPIEAVEWINQYEPSLLLNDKKIL